MAPGSDRSDPRETTERRMTVARVRLQDEYAEVMFFESARIYRLDKTTPGYASAVQLLRDAAADRQSVWVTLAEPNGGVIAAVSAANRNGRR